ncbi:GRF zinc finger domain containing protein [Niveomyces insectorum RCEF 264]|uniref:GRF zinc finger domain containing protein n=1 Tax=Niveomyces insectorum RCEF 264 TaxID=1081102 RepID=A0A167R8U4_9HYPO|nr:GRF zinc finger domain containing protein [Niveomyces insectorum RCEF 264]
MDAFVVKNKNKRRKVTPPLSTVQSLTEANASGGSALLSLKENPRFNKDDKDDEPSTEIKLALLASLVDDISPPIGQDVLLDVLLDHDGSVSAAAEALRAWPDKWGSKATIEGRKSNGLGRCRVIGHQTSLRMLIPASPTTSRNEGTRQPCPSKRGRTLFLYDPVDVDAHTPCTLVHNFLPAEMANEFLRELLEEAATFSTPHTFKLFDQLVSSPHTSCLYLESVEEAATSPGRIAQRDSGDGGGGANVTDGSGHRQISLTADVHDGYRYNGARLPEVRASTPQMIRVRPLVQAAVNAAVQQRIADHYPGARKLPHQHPGPWRPNAAFVNCYAGGQQSVGWHSDQMTYLGPRAVIGSLSLGVAREFRVRRIIPSSAEGSGSNPSTTFAKSAAADDNSGQISIHLPHNSLLVMHAEMQEEWKHCIPPAASIDPHPVAGNKRINITYRDYRPEFHPRYTPRCRCGIATVLRVVQRKQENIGRYFWMCHAGNIPGKKGCSFFEWAHFDDDGNPVWNHNYVEHQTGAG